MKMYKNRLLNRYNKLYEDLISTFTDKKQFTTLNKLLDLENEISKVENE